MPAAKSIPPSLTDVPSSFNAQSSGNVSFDHEYFYVKYNGWRRFPLIETFNLGYRFPDPSNNGDIYTDNQYFYIVVNHKWKRLPIFIIKPNRPFFGEVPSINIQNTKLTTFPRGTDNYGRWGMISFNAEYFCIWGWEKWHKIPVVRMPERSYARAVSLPEPPGPIPNGIIVLNVELI